MICFGPLKVGDPCIFCGELLVDCRRVHSQLGFSSSLGEWVGQAPVNRGWRGLWPSSC